MVFDGCSPGANKWIEAHFHDCIYTARDAISFTLGLASILAWVVAQVPQFVSNIQNQSAEALSVWFLAQWFLGDTLNLLGCLVQGQQLPTTTALAMYFVLSDVIMLMQFIYFTALAKRRERMRELAQANKRHRHRHQHHHHKHRQVQQEQLPGTDSGHDQDQGNHASNGTMGHEMKDEQPQQPQQPQQQQQQQSPFLPPAAATTLALLPPADCPSAQTASCSHCTAVVPAEHARKSVGGEEQEEQEEEEDHFHHFVTLLEEHQQQQQQQQPQPCSCTCQADPLQGAGSAAVHGAGAPARCLQCQGSLQTGAGAGADEACRQGPTLLWGGRQHGSSCNPAPSSHSHSPSPWTRLRPLTLLATSLATLLTVAAAVSYSMPLAAGLLGLASPTHPLIFNPSQQHVTGTAHSLLLSTPSLWPLRLLPGCDPGSGGADADDYHGSADSPWWCDTNALQLLAGTAMGYLSTCLYLSSRVSQIYKNAKRGSAEGLSLAMFCLSVTANLCTGLSIVLRLKAIEALQDQLPWIIGTFGTVGLDITIAYQTITYQRRAAAAAAATAAAVATMLTAPLLGASC